MRKSRIKKAFTLVELVIVLIVISILIGVLFQVYTTIAQVSIRIRLEKQVGIKVVHMQTLIQNIIDTNRVDYARLQAPEGRTTQIPLKNMQGQTGALSITDTGEIMYTSMSGETQVEVSLLGDEVLLESGSFVITPLKDPKAEEVFMAIQQPGIWLFGHLSPAIKDTKIQFPIQTFYTFIQK